MKICLMLILVTLLCGCSFNKDNEPGTSNSNTTTVSDYPCNKPVYYDYVSQNFGNYYSLHGYHTGVDLLTSNRNDGVKAFIDGNIVYINKNTYATKYNTYWNSLIILESIYKNKKIYLYFGHLEKYQFSLGDSIKKNETIGYIRDAYDKYDNIIKQNNHLHLSVKDNLIKNIWGYINNKNVSDYGWKNPLVLFGW